MPIIGYVHTGIEKSLRGPGVLEGHPVRRADGLPGLLLQRRRLLQGRRAAARHRDPAARAVPARHPPGAQPDRQPPVLARHLDPRPRRDVDGLLRDPRARPGARPVRDVGRPAPAHALLPGRRRASRTSRRAGSDKVRAFLARLPRADRPVRGDPRQERDLPAAHEGRRGRAARGAARAVGDRPAAARDRRPVGPAQGRSLLGLRPLRLRGPGRHGRRQLRPLHGPHGRRCASR